MAENISFLVFSLPYFHFFFLNFFFPDFSVGFQHVAQNMKDSFFNYFLSWSVARIWLNFFADNFQFGYIINLKFKGEFPRYIVARKRQIGNKRMAVDNFNSEPVVCSRIGDEKDEIGTQNLLATYSQKRYIRI